MPTAIQFICSAPQFTSNSLLQNLFALRIKTTRNFSISAQSDHHISSNPATIQWSERSNSWAYRGERSSPIKSRAWLNLSEFGQQSALLRIFLVQHLIPFRHLVLLLIKQRLRI